MIWVYGRLMSLWVVIQIGEFMGCDSDEWVFELEIWVRGEMVGSRGWWMKSRKCVKTQELFRSPN